jgi:predicted O-methyltransferase YrrM
MSWFWETRTYASEKNGAIRCRRFLGRWAVEVGGFHESSRYLADVWRGAYRRFPRQAVVRDVLMLGLAAGDNVALLGRRFPGCRVVAVEWDPTMVRIADELGVIPDGARPEVIVGDAAAVLPTLARAFDLVLVDIFTGGKVGASAHGERFFADVAARLRPGGHVIVNAFWEPEVLDRAGRDLTPVARWRGINNHMGIFRLAPIPAGDVS